LEQKQVRKNNIKKLFRWILNIVLVFFTIPFVLTFMFRDPIVQSLTARMLTKWLSEKTAYHIELEKVRLTAFKGLSFEELKIDDHRGEAMLHVNHLSAQPAFSDWNLLFLKFKSIDIDGAFFRYARYKEDKDYNLMIFLNKYLDRDSTDQPKKSSAFHLNTGELVLTNSTFHLYDEHKHYANEIGVNYADMLIDSICLYGHEFNLINDSLHIQVDSLFAHEKSGFTIDRMSADFGISSTNLIAHNLLLDNDDSHIDMDLDFDYSSYSSYSSFIDSVRMTGDIRPSTIDLSVIGYFADVMFQMPDVIGISGFVTGPVSFMEGEQLRIKYGRTTRFYGNALIKGLPDFFTSYMEAEIFELSTSACDLKSFTLPDEEYKHIDLSDLVTCDELFTAKGSFKGYYEDFKTKLSIHSEEGILSTDVDYKNSKDQGITIEARLQSDQFLMGKLLDIQDVFGHIAMDLNMNASGTDLSTLKIDVDGFFSSVDFMEYPYQRIAVNGWYQKDSIKGTIRVGDKNLMMGADVALNLSQGPLLKAQMNIKYADPVKLHLVSSDNFRITTVADLLMEGFDPDSMSGKLILNNTVLYFDDRKYPVQHVELLKSHDEQDLIEIHSDYADARMEGKFNITETGDLLAGLFDHYYHVDDHTSDSVIRPQQQAAINIEVKDGILVEEQLIPGLYLSPGTNLHAQIDYSSNELAVMMNSELIEYSGNSLNGNKFVLNTGKDVLTYDYSVNRIVLKDSTAEDKRVFGIDNFRLNGSVENDSLAWGIYWQNMDSLLKNSAVIEGCLTYDTGVSVLRIRNTEVYINDTLWQVEQGNSVVMDTVAIHINNLVLHGAQSRMSISGEFPESNSDTLNVSFNDWNLSHFDIVTKMYGFDLNGQINGVVEVTRPFTNLTFETDLKIKNLYFNRQYMGTATLKSKWNNASKSVFIDSDIIREGSSGQGRVFSAIGYYYPFREEENFDLKIDFNRLKIKTIEPFFIEYVSNIEGVASGNFKLTGTPESPQLVGMVDMKRAAMVVNYLNTKYSFSNAVIFEPDRINFNELVIYDTLGNNANIKGYLTHNHFKNSVFDVRLSTDKLLFFNTTRRMNDLYYGTAVTSGDLLLTGDANNLKLKIEVSTLDGTKVNLPLDYVVEISDKDYIVFIHPEDSVDVAFMQEEELPLDQTEEENQLSYDINLKMDINPKASITIFVPNDLGKIESKGRGVLTTNFNSDGEFSISGDYTVDNGLFNLRIANLVNKRFELVKGGRISWSGDPYLANLNIKGVYRLKTNISSLGIMIDSTSDYKNKVIVECYVVLTNQLNNPNMRFELRLPDLDPDLQRAVFAEIDTTNPAMLNQQVMSLLVLGSFSASNASNITLSSSYYTVITNQLSKMLSRISDDFDIGINYKPGDQVSQEEFEFALSTQLFNDRLSVAGNVGMTYDRVQRNASNIVGDVDISYKLTEDGRWVLKAYNHSNVNSWYNYSNYDKVSPYTQGVGVGYTKEFNNLAELFKRTRPRKKDKRNSESIKNEEDEEL